MRSSNTESIPVATGMPDFVPDDRTDCRRRQRITPTRERGTTNVKIAGFLDAAHAVRAPRIGSKDDRLKSKNVDLTNVVSEDIELIPRRADYEFEIWQSKPLSTSRKLCHDGIPKSTMTGRVKLNAVATTRTAVA